MSAIKRFVAWAFGFTVDQNDPDLDPIPGPVDGYGSRPPPGSFVFFRRESSVTPGTEETDAEYRARIVATLAADRDRQK